MKIEKTWFEDNYIFIQTDTGHIVGNPVNWFPRLANAPAEQLLDMQIYGEGIHWPQIDEDLSLRGFFFYKNNLVDEKIIATTAEQS